MGLHWENVVNYSNQIYPFEQLQVQNHNELLFPSETELLCFDSVPPTLFDIDDIIVDPNFDQQFDYSYNDLITPNFFFDIPTPLFFPTEDNFPCSKKQRITLPCFSEFVPESVTIGGNSDSHYHYCVNQGDQVNNGDYNGVVIKEKSVSAQSRAARERRRKITEKTQELGKLVPGGSKMNTAQMLESSFKYVKFLQAQLGILQMKTMNEEIGKMMSPNNLSILASDVVQEKLYTKEKCLVPLDLLPMIEQHLDFETNIIH